MNVITIFRSIEGEGFNVGTPTVFVRLSGCSIQCKWCDTKESWPEDAGKEMSPLEIIGEVKSRVYIEGTRVIHRVSITGGNPMESSHSDLIHLINTFHDGDFIVNIEHPGVFLDYSGEMDVLRKLTLEGDTVSFDIKPPSAGLGLSFLKHTLVSAIHELQRAGVSSAVKAVYANEEDLQFIGDCFDLLESSLSNSIPCSIQPCDANFVAGNISAIPLNRILEVLGLMDGSRLIPQIHKVLKFP